MEKVFKEVDFLGLVLVFILVVGSGGLGWIVEDLVKVVFGVICVFLIRSLFSLFCEIWVVVFDYFIIGVFVVGLEVI